MRPPGLEPGTKRLRDFRPVPFYMMQIQRLRFTEAIYEHFIEPQNFAPLRICYGF